MLTNILITLVVSLLPILPENGPVLGFTFADNDSPAAINEAAATCLEANPGLTTEATPELTPEDTTTAAPQSQTPPRRYWTVTGAPYLDEVVPVAIRPVIGLSTNLPYDITYIPNYGLTSVPSFGLEFYPARGHWTFGADIDWSHWRHYDSHRFNQIHNITLSTRRYFRDSKTVLHTRNGGKASTESSFSGFYGLYLSGSINAAQYGLGWDAHGWEGEGLGVGLGIGYKWPLGRRMYLDLGAAAGFFYSRYDPYVWGNDGTGWYYYDYTGDFKDFVRRRMALSWFGPTRVYISLGINLFDRNKK